MLNQAILVVSDKFSNFAIRKDIITVSELNELLTENNIFLAKEKKITFMPGQGLNEQTIQYTMKKMVRHQNFQNFDLSAWISTPEKASSRITHKHKEENILISTPHRVNKNEFTMDLLVDESCELMQDHQTGLHIQGIVLLEAARQSYIAIYEKYLSSEKDKKSYFIFNNMNVDYNKFSFPIPAKIKAIIKAKEFKRTGNKVVMDIEIIQCDSVSATLSLEMSIFESVLISKLETKMAREVMSEHINQSLQESNEMETLIYA